MVPVEENQHKKIIGPTCTWKALLIGINKNGRKNKIDMH